MSYPLDSQTDITPPSWLTNKWLYMTQIDATVISTTMRLYPQRQQDTAIMESSKSYKGTLLQRINAVRLYLQVFFLSDIVNSSGYHIDPSYTKPNQPQHRKTTLQCPNQHLPPPKAWTDWRALLRKQFTYPRTFKLRRPVGQWLNPPHPTQQWHSLIDPTPTSYTSKRTLLAEESGLNGNRYHAPNTSFSLHRPPAQPYHPMQYLSQPTHPDTND